MTKRVFLRVDAYGLESNVRIPVCLLDTMPETSDEKTGREP
jgi:hypothetical protein